MPTFLGASWREAMVGAGQTAFARPSRRLPPRTHPWQPAQGSLAKGVAAVKEIAKRSRAARRGLRPAPVTFDLSACPAAWVTMGNVGGRRRFSYFGRMP